MKKITVTFITLLLAMAAFAGPVSRQQALQTATAYLNKQQSVRGVTQPAQLSLAYECMPKSGRGASVSSPLYYVFNQGQQQGFVVVAGDDRVKPVLGYVYEGSFSISNVHDGMRWWLGALEETMISVTKMADNGQRLDLATDDSDLKPYVAPMVKVNWGQGAPYNDRCPVDINHGSQQRSLVGCTAVAMAQVLSKWNYPVRAKGNISYTTRTHKFHLTENLSTFQFDWDDMLPSYSNGMGTAEQRAAVAELMYACGLSVEMDYCAIASGATASADIFEKTFDIDDKCNLISRHYFTKPEWDEIMNREMSEGRPVVYSGFSLDAGHAFVCDGYNRDGLFHINWGWDGSLNGYFALAELNSAVEHAGAPTDEAGSFNLDQYIVIGIEPSNHVADDINHVAYFHCLTDYGKAMSRNHISMNVKTVTTDGNGFKGVMSLGVFDKEGKFVCAFGKSYSLDVKVFSFYNSLALGGSLPAEVKDGVYTLRPVTSCDGKPYQAMRGRMSSPYVSYLTMKVNGNTVLLSEPTDVEADFTILSVKPMNEKAFVGVKNPIEIRLRNDGALYNGPIVLQREGDGGQKRVFANNYIVDKGEELVIRTNVEAPASGKTDELVVWMAGYDDDMYFSNGFKYERIGTVKYDLTTPVSGTPKLSYTNLKMKKTMVHVGEKVEIDFKVKNDGGFYGNSIYAYAFRDGASQSQASAHSAVFLDKGETCDVHLEIPIDHLQEGSYRYFIYYMKLPENQLELIDNRTFSFTVKNTGSFSIANSELFNVVCLDYAFIMPDRCKAGIVTKADLNNICVDYCYQSGDIVPANSPIVVQSERRGTQECQIVLSDELPMSGNLLSVQVDEKGYTYAGEGEFKYYQFTHGGNRKNYGFYQSKPDGAPYLLSEGKAYLAVPVAQAKADGYILKGATVTGIENLINAQVVNEDDAIYTLSGVRVKGDLKSLPKGLYIVGGKKVYVK